MSSISESEELLCSFDVNESLKVRAEQKSCEKYSELVNIA